MNRTIKIYYYDTFKFNQHYLNNFKKKIILFQLLNNI